MFRRGNTDFCRHAAISVAVWNATQTKANRKFRMLQAEVGATLWSDGSHWIIASLQRSVILVNDVVWNDHDVFLPTS